MTSLSLLVVDRGAASVRVLEAAVKAVGERGLGIQGVHVAVDGQPPVEQHWASDVRRDVFSASKTVTSMAVGIAEAEGLLDLDDSVLAHLGPFASASAGVEQITIQHLLTMSSGVVYRWEDPDADHPDDPVRAVLSAPLGAAPGSRFAYRGANTYLLSRIIHACSGQDLCDYLVPRLFTPLGIHNPQWLRCSRGYSLGAVGLHLRTEELARLACVLLDNGRWNNRCIVPSDYVDGMTADTVPTDGHVASRASAPHPDNARYGRHVWMCARDDAWRMDGIYGQFGIVLPTHHACVTVTADYRGPTTDILDAIWAEIVPAINW